MLNLISMCRACKQLSLTRSDCCCLPCLLLVFTHAILYALHARHTHVLMICPAQSKILAFHEMYHSLNSFLGSLLLASHLQLNPCHLVSLMRLTPLKERALHVCTGTKGPKGSCRRQGIPALDAVRSLDVFDMKTFPVSKFGANVITPNSNWFMISKECIHRQLQVRSLRVCPGTPRGP